MSGEGIEIIDGKGRHDEGVSVRFRAISRAETLYSALYFATWGTSDSRIGIDEKTKKVS